MPLSRALESLRVSKSREHTVAGEISAFYGSWESVEDGLSIKQQHLTAAMGARAPARAPHCKRGCCDTWSLSVRSQHVNMPMHHSCLPFQAVPEDSQLWSSRGRSLSCPGLTSVWRLVLVLGWMRVQFHIRNLFLKALAILFIYIFIIFSVFLTVIGVILSCCHYKCDAISEVC